MKIEHLIVQFLYSSKKLTLQDIGTFILSPDVVIDPGSDKETVLPENAVSFTFDKKAPQDEELISFIVSQTRKIRPLASSDLESYSILAKQFLNIGKPFPIEGLGVLKKNQEGEYEFMQGAYMNAKLDAAPALLKEKAEDEISFSTQPRQKPSTKKWAWLLLLLVIGCSGALLYYFFVKKDKLEKVKEPLVLTDSITKPVDSLVNIIPPARDSIKTDSSGIVKDSSYTFRIVIREYPGKEAAEKAFAKYTLYGHKLMIYPKDSLAYKLAMPFKSPLSDTARARDSLRIFFNARTYVEKD